jgi:hypothetical protein
MYKSKIKRKKPKSPQDNHTDQRRIKVILALINDGG